MALGLQSFHSYFYADINLITMRIKVTVIAEVEEIWTDSRILAISDRFALEVFRNAGSLLVQPVWGSRCPLSVFY